MRPRPALRWAHDRPADAQCGAPDRPLRADDAPGGARRRDGAPALRLRGVHATPARGAALRGGRGDRAGPGDAVAVPVRDGRARLAGRRAGGRRRDAGVPGGLPVHRVGRRVRGGRGVLPVVAGHGRRGHVRGGGPAGDARPVDPQLRLGGRVGGLAHDERGGRPAVPGDGVATRARGGGGRGGPGGGRSPGSRGRRTWRRGGGTGWRRSARPRTRSRCCTTTRRRRSRRRWRRSARARRSWWTRTTCAAAWSWRWRPRGPGWGRCGSTPATWRSWRTRSARSWTRPAPGARRSRSPRTSTSTRSRRSPWRRWTPTGSARRW